MFGLRWVSVATSALLWPWVISAKISDSRLKSLAAARPVQSADAACPKGRLLITMSPAWIASRAATRSRAGNAFDKYPLTPCLRAFSITSGWKFQV